MRVLTVYASAHGSTVEVARLIADIWGQRGLYTDVAAVDSLPSLEGYNAYALGSAIHSGLWLPEMATFVRQSRELPATKPVYNKTRLSLAELPAGNRAGRLCLRHQQLQRRGFCPSCGARRMVQTAAYLVDPIIPHVPVRQWVLSFPIPLRILFAAHPELLTPVLRIVHRVITRFLLKQAGLKRCAADTGAVTLIQRFGSAANLNIHLHCLVLGGVYRRTDGEPLFDEARAPSGEELKGLLDKIIVRLMKMLTAKGYLIEEQGMAYLADIDADKPLASLQAASCTYRIAFGPRAGQKVLSLRTVAGGDEKTMEASLCAEAHGFSLHAAVRAGAHQRRELERLCRYITRPAIANERLSGNAKGQVVLQLKSAYRDGTTHIVMQPQEFMQRLAALVPRPRLHLIRCHGVLAPHAKLRAAIVPDPAHKTSAPVEEHVHGESARMSWARLLKRVFDIDVERCPHCGGVCKIITAIEDPAVIGKILSPLGLSARAPPRARTRLPQLIEVA